MNGAYNRRMFAIAALFAVIQVLSPVWNDAPPSMPKGTKIAVLEGSPTAAGLFTIRLKVPRSATLGKHTHPRAERVTVLSGKVRVMIGGKTTTFGPGGFYVNPPNEPHSLVFLQESVLQLTCEGPWEVKFVD
jgi:quercetin dioxygenase-like cupin family protein